MTINILYIIGSGRSGSTILGNILGQVDGFAHLGEVRQIWREPAANQMCGCAVTVRACPFWRDVFDDAFGGFDEIDVESVRQLLVRSTKLRHLPALYVSGLNARRGALRSFLETTGKFYESIGRVSGGRMLVDSSKVPSYGFALKMIPGARVFFLHLVRDPRAVAYSWTRAKYQPDRHDYVGQLRLTESSLIWMAWNAAIEAIKTQAEGYLCVRYEDLVSDPRRELQRILAFVGNDTTELPSFDQRDVFLKPQHTIAGNPDRFRVGHVKIRPDEAWRGGMGTARKCLVTALTAPLLLRYGYRLAS